MKRFAASDKIYWVMIVNVLLVNSFNVIYYVFLCIHLYILNVRKVNEFMYLFGKLEMC